MGRLDEKVAIVTGAARGTGEATARLFVAEGARVVIADIRDDQGKRVADELGDRARYVHCDVCEEDDWAAAVEATVAEFGRVDILVNNAAVLHLATIAKTTVDDYLKVMRVNELGTFLGIRTVIGPMSDAGGGSIINVSSIDGVYAAPFTSAYSASKFAVRGLAKVAASELGHLGIRVNTICPAAGNFEMVAEALPEAARSQLGGRGHAERGGFHPPPVGRFGMPGDVAKTALFLASDDSGYFTGADLILDGGTTAAMNLQALRASGSLLVE